MPKIPKFQSFNAGMRVSGNSVASNINRVSFVDTLTSRMPNFTQDVAGGLGYSKVGSKWMSPLQTVMSKEAGVFAKGNAVLSAGFIGLSAYEGFKENGLVGAGKGAVSGAASAIFWNAAFRAALTPTGAAIGATAALGMGSFMMSQKMMNTAWTTHINKIPLEFAGSTAAFNTNNAATMRQRSTQSIQRSYLNARSAFSNEAQIHHIASYRGLR